MAGKDEKREMTVIVKAKELAAHTFKLTSNSDRYPKKYRHSLVDRMQLKSLDIYEKLMEANRIDNRNNKYLRCETITKAITYCEELDFFIELSMNIGILNPQSAMYWSKMTESVKHMAIAWRTKEQK